jgi:betaine-aldehyde dehydrogenase
MDVIRNFIAGSFTEARTDATAPIVDPARGEQYLVAPVSGVPDIDLACQAAASAFSSWRQVTPAERSLALSRIADALEARSDEFIEAESRNTGKPLTWMSTLEFPMILDHLRYFATLARTAPGVAMGEYISGYESAVRREPVGVCGQITPWNYPLLMAVWKVGSALAAGNTVVLKPSETTPVTTVMLAEAASGQLPPGVLNVVVGDRGTGAALVQHSRPDLISITGSTRAGRDVAAVGGGALKRVHLELGGKAPALVFADGDLAATARAVAEAAFGNAGQDCAAATRVLIERSAREEFLARVIERAQATRYGLPHEDVDYGPLNSEAHLARVQGYVDRIPAHGKIETGGTSDRRHGGYFFAPTVITGLSQDDEMVQSEIFGPVLTVQAFDSEEEAIALGNGVEYGLAASIWTESTSRAHRLSRALDFGQIWVNCHLIQAAEMPNGGFKSSGHGNDLSWLALEDYTRVKHIMTAVP